MCAGAAALIDASHDLREAELTKLRLDIRTLQRDLGFQGVVVKLIPLLTALVAVAGFLVGVRQNNIARENEFKRYFWEQQLRYYVDAAESASALATLPEGPERDAAHVRFQQLYHGGLVVFEDESVAFAMRDFAQNYMDYKRNRGLQVVLQRSARDLATACKESLAQQWDVSLKDRDVRRR